MITLEGGKYTVELAPDGRLRALRHGKEWRDLTGDKLVLALVHEVERLRGKHTARQYIDGEDDHGAAW
jgi:hypothetical protein